MAKKVYSLKPQSRSVFDPPSELKRAYGIIFFLASLNLVLGAVVILFQIELPQSIGTGWAIFISGLIYLVLGFFVTRRSMVALLIAIVILALDSILSVCLATQWSLGSIMGSFTKVFFLIIMIQGIGGIRELNAKNRKKMANINKIKSITTKVDIQQQPEGQEQQCPECQAIIPVHVGFTTWCDQCGWNLRPQDSTVSSSLFTSLYTAIGGKLGQNLFNELVQAKSLKPRLTLAKVMAFVFATIIHGLTFIFTILGITLLVAYWPNIFAIIGGLICIGIAWGVFPRFPKPLKINGSRDKFPTLYKITDRITQMLETSNITGIVIGDQFNAAYIELGLRRKKVLYIGLPLFCMLDNQERVALLAHELSHGVNGDPIRGFFIGSAIDSLIQWSESLQLYKPVGYRAGLPMLDDLTVSTNLVLLVFSLPVWIGLYLLNHLLCRDSQRAEYLADYLAAQISGTEATVSMLKKFYFSGTFRRTVQTIVLSQNYNQNLFDEFQRRILEVPERELDRMSRVEQLEVSRLNITHPPTFYRIEFLKARYVPNPKFVLPPEDMKQLDNELKLLQKRVQKKLINLYRQSLY